MSPESVDLDVERNVLTVTAQRQPLDEQSRNRHDERDPDGQHRSGEVLGESLGDTTDQATVRRPAGAAIGRHWEAHPSIVTRAYVRAPARTTPASP